jgi:hypothetical protein
VIFSSHVAQNSRLAAGECKQSVNQQDSRNAKTRRKP